MLKQLLGLAARRAASDPRVQKQARRAVETHGKPFVEQKAAEVREIASKTNPREKPARFAGRVFQRFLDG